jgi:hypothetical protein
MVEKDEILSEIRRLAKENGGKPFGRNRFFEAMAELRRQLQDRAKTASVKPGPAHRAAQAVK